MVVRQLPLLSLLLPSLLSISIPKHNIFDQSSEPDLFQFQFDPSVYFWDGKAGDRSDDMFELESNNTSPADDTSTYVPNNDSASDNLSLDSASSGIQAHSIISSFPEYQRPGTWSVWSPGPSPSLDRMGRTEYTYEKVCYGIYGCDFGSTIFVAFLLCSHTDSNRIWHSGCYRICLSSRWCNQSCGVSRLLGPRIRHSERLVVIVLFYWW